MFGLKPVLETSLNLHLFLFILIFVNLTVTELQQVHLETLVFNAVESQSTSFTLSTLSE